MKKKLSKRIAAASAAVLLLTSAQAVVPPAGIPITVASADNSLEFRVWWYGSSPLDVAEIRVR
ncbi:hypothetical protein V1227_04225 [Lentzea sp. DG1S-22]|uniref:hypothetical protein n=1 Tax=Lentzea sp. DG1S-22 TaxID=3108822 RepID=UPI002E79C543|nr:hypothetical protein [Lentzea sp. DG1S-22]WVH81965.1 hypothetical protein V1227_04225 [Lentzea sp. DG1S-22]